MTTTLAAGPDLFARHREKLDKAREAIRSRAYYSAFPESPSPRIYGESAAAEGKAAFEARLGKPFALDQPSTGATVATERSPYGIALGVQYPVADVDALIASASAAVESWGAVSADARTGVALEALARLNVPHGFEMAHAVQHTTGQAFVMAFQAGGPHALDRALEAVAYAYEEMARVPESVVWEKPAKPEPIRVRKTYALVPRGIDVTIGCSTFPTWNAYPGIFASLVTGNAVIVKPHPQAVLPLAITVAIIQGVLREAGYDPRAVQLAVDTPEKPLAKVLAQRPEVALLDYTGSTEFGDWLEKNSHALVYTEKAGVNSVVIDSTDDLKGMARNLGMSLSLYSGQMCTTPQNLFVPKDGIVAGGQKISFDDVVAAVVKGVDGLLGDPERAAGVLGAIATDGTLRRIEEENAKPGVVRKSAPVANAEFPNARVHSPLIAVVDAADRERYDREAFGPIAFVVRTADTDESLRLATGEAQRRGAITAIVHTTSDEVLAKAQRWARDGKVNLAVNLTGTLLVNQSAAFSDYHVTGGNPAGNASLTDAAFVANRFRIIETRTPVASESAAAGA
ncbi:MAG TPA: phenylacetic acid degradation protein PaaN [Candidatus Elarobacter sp.]|nr:phenylacetic acid degradation protein PaaN [Dongiaceae bacterium]HZW53553.1 phenylacetic acid degradation protein PaaN [Candidatus Elarobacter sp.]